MWQMSLRRLNIMDVGQFCEKSLFESDKTELDEMHSILIDRKNTSDDFWRTKKVLHTEKQKKTDKGTFTENTTGGLHLCSGSPYVL